LPSSSTTAASAFSSAAIAAPTGSPAPISGIGLHGAVNGPP